MNSSKSRSTNRKYIWGCIEMIEMWWTGLRSRPRTTRKGNVRSVQDLKDLHEIGLIGECEEYWPRFIVLSCRFGCAAHRCSTVPFSVNQGIMPQWPLRPPSWLHSNLSTVSQRHVHHCSCIVYFSFIFFSVLQGHDDHHVKGTAWLERPADNN